MNETPLNAIESEGPSAPPRLRFTPSIHRAVILGAYLVLQVAATVAAMAMLGLDPAARMGDLVALA